MDLNEYQERAASTAIYPKTAGLLYTVLGLVGEAGEVAQKLKKQIRDKKGDITGPFKMELAQEIGDVLWYVALLSKELGFSLDEIGASNLFKLAARQSKNTLQGSGDNR